MKEIDLIKYEVHSIKLPPEAIGLSDIEGECSVEITKKRSSKMTKIEVKDPLTGETVGEAKTAEGDKELTQARKNGSQVIYATIMIESQLNNIIANYLFGNLLPNSKRDFFINNILCTGQITFAAKKTMVLGILDELKFYGNPSPQNSRRKKTANKNKNEFNKLLKDAMEYRNAFAHGKLEYESPTGCVLSYYSGEHKNLVLDDNFWTNKIEKIHARLEVILKDISASIESGILKS